MTKPIQLASMTFSGIDLERIRGLLSLLAENVPASWSERQAAAILRRRISAQIDEHVKEHGE